MTDKSFSKYTDEETKTIVENNFNRISQLMKIDRTELQEMELNYKIDLHNMFGLIFIEENDRILGEMRRYRNADMGID